MSVSPPDAPHYAAVIDAMEKGRLIPFFGAGVNLCIRPPDYDYDQPWDPNSGFLPSARELSHCLAGFFQYPAPDRENLLRVSQFVATNGTSVLDDHLHMLFNRDYTITPLHRFFAALPALLAKRGVTNNNLLIISTNYDDLMERAFEEAEQPYDRLSYIRDDENRGKFVHYRSTDGHTEIVHSANDYAEIDVANRPVLLKIHGAVQRCSDEPENHNFVITEDNYIDYLTGGDVVKRIPSVVSKRFHRSQFLFLGYSLTDWNMRAFFRGVKREQATKNKGYVSWAVQLRHDEIEQKFWRDRDVTIYDKELSEYIRDLQCLLDERQCVT